MAKKKRVRHVWLGEWHVEELEAWFEDMIKQGWKLEKINLGFATFVKTKPEERRYRIEIANKNDEIESDRIHLYDDAGWDYITNENFLYVFLEREPNTAKEIHSDPVMQAETIEILKKSLFRRGIGLFLATTFMLALVLFSVRDITSYYILSDNFLFPLMIILIYLPLSLYHLYGIFHISSLVKRVRSGDGFRHQKPYRAKVNWIRFWSIALFSTFIFIFGYSVYLDIFVNDYDGRDAIPSGELTVISLAEIENVSRDEVTYKPHENRRLHNHYREEVGLIAPNQYYLRETFVIPGKNPLDYSEDYEPTLDSRRYETISVLAAKYLVEALVEEKMYRGLEYQTSRNLPFDEVWLDEGDNHITMVARVGNVVYDIDYHGWQSNRVLFEKLEEHVEKEAS
ncbi:DUF2812 domain-containing protein [Oceanobacillus sp. CAU 1775]